MGSSCSKDDKETEEGPESRPNQLAIRQSLKDTFPTEKKDSGTTDMASSGPQGPLSANYSTDSDIISKGFSTTDSYLDFRNQFINHEKVFGFEAHCQTTANEKEQRADEIIRTLRKRDSELYASAPHRQGCNGQLHPRVPGDHFLSNRDLIEDTELLKVARQMPKGAHLHIHFNACLLPNVLLEIAEGMDRMFITSDLPLIPGHDYANFEKCEIQFCLCSTEKENPGDLYSQSYEPRHTMRFKDFLNKFPKDYYDGSAKKWLMHKLVFHEDETHNLLQTAAGAWEKFNGRTRMMKGLFNYATAYRKYTRACLDDFMRDNIQYAEIRPNFMTSNQLYHDDGTGPIDNWGIMEIIIDEVKSFKADIERENRFFGGVKVIYCTPRSFSNEKVKAALDECIEFKKRWPEWIAGFDLVGEEAAGYPLKQFIPEFLQFQQDCEAANLDIPFLFHCGETLDTGTDTDANLVDALLLKSKRIGHGFALTRHPYVMKHMKERGVCLELCPISNEILGLTPRVGGHTMYELLANNVHCTVSSDNGTLFRSTLSHDFYQVMVGKADMGLAGWKQLVLWSIEHSCMNKAERDEVEHHWQKLWEEFLDWIVQEYGHTIMKDEELQQVGSS